LRQGKLAAADYALWRARSLFQLASVRARFGVVARPGPHDGTLVLRDLVARYGELGPDGRTAARRLLARPDDGAADPARHGYSVPAAVNCTTNFCVHWVATTSDAPSPDDANGNAIPDYVETVQSVLENVWTKEVVDYGYRPPKSDETSTNHGPDAKVDVYIADLGSDGLYGYCTTDDPNVFTSSYPYGDVSAYCVVDNDFSTAQYGGAGAVGVDALEVTVAHEFFHAVQAAYDFFDDGVLLEGTAVWMEDEVYDDINDNYQYLAYSALKRPDVPFDLALTNFSNPLAGFQYGAFVFYRYLSERYATPDIVKRIWEFADASPGGPDQYSLQAIDSALRERGTTFRTTFADWAAANTFPAAAYEEGAHYPVPPEKSSPKLNARAARTSGHATLDHLTSRYIELLPGAALKNSARLRLQLDLPARALGSDATVLAVSLRGGIVAAVRATLNGKGDGTVTVPFSRSKVAKIVLVLTNAGADYDCNRGTTFACEGAPREDGLAFRYTAKVV
jgi:hypothetical protein